MGEGSLVKPVRFINKSVFKTRNTYTFNIFLQSKIKHYKNLKKLKYNKW